MQHNPRLAKTWTAQIITLFPQAFPGVLGASLTGKALQDRKWALDTIDLRAFGDGKHKNVDDTPAGGGAGMVLRADVVGKAIDHAAANAPQGRPIVYLSPRGKPFTQAKAQEWSQGSGVILLCGRFEGVDQRVLDHYNIEEVSLGDFVLTGGEIAAQAMIDATVRLLPEVLGNAASTEEESHSKGLLEHPNTPALRFGTASTYQKCCNPGIMERSRNGAKSNRISSPKKGDQICGWPIQITTAKTNGPKSVILTKNHPK